jgi:hypothetical protein
MSPTRVPGAARPKHAVSTLPRAGTYVAVPTDSDRDLEQELAAGQDETTPVIALGSVIMVLAGLFAIALALVVTAYLLA